MTFICRTALIAAVLVVVSAVAPAVFGDEGMWLFNNPPRQVPQGEVRLRADRRVARARAEIVGALQQRRLRLVRLAPTAWS